MSSNSPTRPHSYLIIGTGVFGISTALSLIQKHPTARITLIDRDAPTAPSRVAASWDWNKVIRADYSDPLYCRLALEAQDVFRSDSPLWRPYYHETGIFWLCRGDYAKQVIANYAALGREKEELRAVGVEEARGLFGGVFGGADLAGVREVLVNRGSGWAEAGKCLRAVTEEVLRLGCEYLVGEVVGLEFEGAECKGVKMADGKKLMADKIVLCTGAYTAKLLEMSAYESGRWDLPAGRRLLAGGIATGMTKLDEKTYPKFADMPVGVQGYSAAAGPFIGSLPPTKDKELKWWGQTIFSNTCEVNPGRFVSMPPAKPDYGQWEVSKRLERDIEHAREVFYGEQARGWRMEKHRICWDAFTTTADFLITPHPAASNLYIATGGNFHGWKFFPVLGKYVVQMMEGKLEDELREKWAWDRERPDASDNPDYPRAEMAGLFEEEWKRNEKGKEIAKDGREGEGGLKGIRARL